MAPASSKFCPGVALNFILGCLTQGLLHGNGDLTKGLLQYVGMTPSFSEVCPRVGPSTLL